MALQQTNYDLKADDHHMQLPCCVGLRWLAQGRFGADATWKITIKTTSPCKLSCLLETTDHSHSFTIKLFCSAFLLSQVLAFFSTSSGSNNEPETIHGKVHPKSSINMISKVRLGLPGLFPYKPRCCKWEHFHLKVHACKYLLGSSLPIHGLHGWLPLLPMVWFHVLGDLRGSHAIITSHPKALMIWG